MSPTKKSERKREELLNQGVALMWERGFNGVSVRDIVQAAGVPKGSFYFYFDSKDDFALEVLKKYVRVSSEHTKPDFPEGLQSPFARLRRVYESRVATFGQESCRKGCMMVNVANELGANNDELRGFIHSHWTNMRKPIEELIAEAIKAGEISDKYEPAELAAFLESSWMGFVTAAKASQDPGELKRAVSFIFDQLLA